MLRVKNSYIETARSGLDGLLKDCHRYMKKHKPWIEDKYCSNCKTKTMPTRCTWFHTEALRLMSCLVGSGIKGHIGKKRYKGHIPSGRIIFVSQER